MKLNVRLFAHRNGRTWAGEQVNIRSRKQGSESWWQASIYNFLSLLMIIIFPPAPRGCVKTRCVLGFQSGFSTYMRLYVMLGQLPAVDVSFSWGWGKTSGMCSATECLEGQLWWELPHLSETETEKSKRNIRFLTVLELIICGVGEKNGLSYTSHLKNCQK